MKSRLLLAAVVLTILLALSAGPGAAQGPASQEAGSPQAAVSSAFTYQGQLKKDGSPINATCAMTFTLYDDDTAGSPVGSPVNASVAVADGLFTVALDFGADIFTGQARWLEVAVMYPGDAGASTLDPRQALTAAPYALSLQPGAVISGTAFAAPLGPGAVLTVRNSASTTAANGVYSRSDSTDGRGVYGYGAADSGENSGVYGRSNSPDGYGVRGHNWADSGTAYGVYGESDSTAGRGLYGLASTTSGQNYGVYGRTESTSGRGVSGLAAASSGQNYGVVGISNSTQGYGVYGLAAADSGYTYGVYGDADSADGIGVYGDGSTGVEGRSSSGRGIYGYTGGGIGIFAHAESADGVALRAEGQQGGNLIEAWHGPLLADCKFYVADNGNVYADGSYLNPASGIAEMLPGAAGLEVGDVLVVGPDGNLARCSTAFQPTVVGVYAPQAGYVGGAVEGATGQVPLAVVGVVTVKVSAENGPIAAGDLLVAAATPGHAMRAGDDPALGTVIGKALSGLDRDTGTLLMLVMLR